MPLDAPASSIDTDFEIVAAIWRIHAELSDRLIKAGGPVKTIRRWLAGHCEAPDDFEAHAGLVDMAVDLELFTPTASGKTLLDRALSSRRPETQIDRNAVTALGTAQFRLIRIVGREGPDLVRLTDVVTQESLVLLDEEISPVASGAPTAMRLCTLASGRQVLISALFVIDEALLAAAQLFVRPGRPLGHGARCAANLYRDAARRGIMLMPILDPPSAYDAQLDGVVDLSKLTAAQRLAIAWMMAEGSEGQARVTARIRQAACLDALVDACGFLAAATEAGVEKVRTAYTHVAEIQIETLEQRARAGVGGHSGILDRVAAEINRHVADNGMPAAAKDIFARLRARWSFGFKADRGADGSVDRVELDRVIQRILALRAKTVDRGCSEHEAMAAAAKIAELLDRYELTLDEVTIRQSACSGVAVHTNRRRRAPVDGCVQPVAHFCDCRAWAEDEETGNRRYIFFGLKADIEAARFLYELIEITFETETSLFRDTEIYAMSYGGERRAALNSFQVGLANGIADKLALLKRARQASSSRTTGFDLVAVKHSVADEEIDKLGLHFTSKSVSGPRRVRGDAYAAGRAAGEQFQPEPFLGR